MAKAGQGKIKVGNANVAKNLQVSSPYGITSLPTLILFKGGKALRKVTGGLFHNQAEGNDRRIYPIVGQDEGSA